jgi:tRNA-dihydrouridine synthase
VTIARGSLGNPWIFREATEFLKSGTLPRRPGLDEIADTMTRHLGSCAGIYGETVGTILFRKFFAWYTRGIPDIKALKEKAFSAKTEAEMKEIIEELGTAKRGILPIERGTVNF